MLWDELHRVSRAKGPEGKIFSTKGQSTASPGAGMASPPIIRVSFSRKYAGRSAAHRRSQVIDAALAARLA